VTAAERMEAEGVFMAFPHDCAVLAVRQALMTGRNYHSAKMGALGEVATSFSEYTECVRTTLRRSPRCCA